MLVRTLRAIPSSEITPEPIYRTRRQFIEAIVGTTAAVALGQCADLRAQAPAPHGRKLDNIQKSPFSTTENLNSWDHITTYNNFYEFGPDKESPARFARGLNPDSWSVAVEGECNKPAVWRLED